MTTLQEAQELYERGEYIRPDACNCTVFPCSHILEEFGEWCRYCGAGSAGGPCECEGCG